MFRYGPESLGGNGYLKEKIDQIIINNDDEGEQNKEIVKASGLVYDCARTAALLTFWV